MQRLTWKIRQRWLRLILYRFFKLLQVNDYTFIFIVASFVGLLAGLLGGGVRYWFTISFEWVWGTGFPMIIHVIPWFPPWLLAVLIPALAGLLIGPLTIRRPAETKGHHGIPIVMEKIALGGGVIPASAIGLRTLATTVTLASGASAGRESPVVQIGAAVGSVLGQWMKLSPDRVKILLSCGGASGLAAAFDTPLAGVMFAAELFLGDWAILSMGPLVVSAVLAVTVERMVYPGIDALLAPAYRIHSVREIALYVVVGVICGVFSWAFARILTKTEDWLCKNPFPAVYHLAVGGVITGLFGYFFPQIRASQFAPISQAMQAEVVVLAAVMLFVAKFTATVVTLGTGFSGGAFSPSLFMGSMLGLALGWSFHTLWPHQIASPGVYALVGMAAFTGSLLHAPMTMVLMSVEMTKSYQAVIPMMAAVMTATIVARTLCRESLYTEVLKRKGINLYMGRDENVLKEITVDRVMHPAVTTIPEDMNFSDIVDRVMANPGLYFPIINKKERVVGVLSLDALKPYLRDEELAGLVVAQDIADESIPVLGAGETLLGALNTMNICDVDELPVVREGHLVGMISRRDITKAYQVAILEKREIRGGMKKVQS